MDPMSWNFWSRFPVGADPRPVVLTGSRVVVNASGFVDSAAKYAWHSGNVDSDVVLPAGVLQLIAPDRQPADPAGRVTIRSCTAVVAGFDTDRGPRQLAALRLDVTGMREPCLVLDPAVEVWWPRAGDRDGVRMGLVQVEADGVTLLVRVTGGERTESVEVAFDEHENVVVATVTLHNRPRTPGVLTTAKGIGMTARGRLREPLGDRVLVSDVGIPYVVVPSA